MIKGDGHVDGGAMTGVAGDGETAANAFQAFAHVRQTIAATLRFRRIKTNSIIGDLDLKFGRFGQNFELNFGGPCMFDRVVQRFSERKEELMAGFGRDRAMG